MAMKCLLLSLTVFFLLCSCSQEATNESTESAAATERQVFTDTDGRTLAVLAGQTLYLSAIAPYNNQLSISEQTRGAMGRLGEILALAALNYSHVVSCHVLLADMEQYTEMNDVYGSFFEDNRWPARTTLEFPGFPSNAEVTLSCVAYTDSDAIEIIRPSEDALPAAMGPYSPAIRAGQWLYLSGQGGRNPATGKLATGISQQTEQTIQTIGIILNAAGLSHENTVLSSYYFLADKDEASINGVVESLYGAGGAPSRALVQLSRLPGNIGIEISTVASSDNYINRLFIHDQEPSALSSPASLSNGTVYTSVSTGIGETFTEQFQDAIHQQQEILHLAFMDLPHVVRVNAYMRDMNNLEELEQLLAEAFPGDGPATTIVQASLPATTGIQLEIIAVQ